MHVLENIGSESPKLAGIDRELDLAGTGSCFDLDEKNTGRMFRHLQIQFEGLHM